MSFFTVISADTLKVTETLTTNQLQTTNTTTATTATTLSQKSLFSEEDKNNNLDSKENTNYPTGFAKVGAVGNSKSETQVNQASQPALPTLQNAPTSQENNIEEKAEDLRAALEAGASADSIEMLMCGWALMERKQVEAVLAESHRQQLQNLVG